MNNPPLIIFCGMSGAGKTTTAELISKEFGIELLNPEAIRREMGRDRYCRSDTPEVLYRQIARIRQLFAEGKTAMFIALDGALVGIVAVADPIKDSTAQAIRELHAQGLRVIMATGDNERTAQAVAGKLGIDEVHIGISDKVAKARELVEKYNTSFENVAFMGDDVPDLELMKHVKYPITVADAADENKKVATYVTKRKGGHGAVREIANLILG